MAAEARSQIFPPLCGKINSHVEHCGTTSGEQINYYSGNVRHRMKTGWLAGVFYFKTEYRYGLFISLLFHDFK